MAEQAGEFKGRVALVTGGSRGIGRAVCLSLAREGANIALNYVSNADAAKETQREIEALGFRCAVCQADVSDAAEVEAMVANADEALGPIDLLVTAAGIAHVGDHREVDLDLWQQIMKVNVDGTFLPVMAVKDGMIERWLRPDHLCRLNCRPGAPRPHAALQHLEGRSDRFCPKLRPGLCTERPGQLPGTGADRD